MKENEIKSEVEENEVEASNIETTETNENVNTEIHNLVNGEEEKKEKSCSKGILANILDQTLLIASSAVLVILCDQILKLFGYRFVQGTGAIIFGAGIIYFILNCLYAPIMENSKAKATIANKILNVN
jgi:hypothetical protein